MVDTNALRAAWVKRGLTQTEVAKKLHISSRTMTQKMKCGVFGSDEIEKLMQILDIENLVAIFFAHTATYKDTV